MAQQDACGVLKLTEIVSNIFSFCIRPVVLFRFNLVCKAWYQLVEEDDFFKEHSKEWKALNSRIDKAFMWTEYYNFYDPIVYDHYLEFKRRVRVLSSDDDYVYVQLDGSNHKKFTFSMKSFENNFVIRIRTDENENIVCDDSKGKELTIQAVKSSYYYHMLETDVDQVDVVNLKSLELFKEAHFPKVPVDGFYSILESMVCGEYDYKCDYLIESGIDRFYEKIDKSKDKVMKIYKDYQNEGSLLYRTLKYKNIEFTENLIRKGHSLNSSQIENLITHIQNSETFTALFMCKYLKANNIDPKKILPDLESILDSSPELCEIFLKEKIVECPDILIDIVNQTTNVNYPALKYLKTVNPKLICPLDVHSIKKRLSPKILILFENPTQEKDQKSYYSSMRSVTCKIFPQSAVQEKVLNNLVEKCNKMDVILLRPQTFSEKLIENLTLIKKANNNALVGIVCFYSSLIENKQVLREVFRNVPNVYLIVESYQPNNSLFPEMFCKLV